MNMTHKIYHDDAYMREFGAEVAWVKPGAVALNRTAFYATSGGQPCDFGMIDGHTVTDVTEEDGVIWHATDGQFSIGDSVHGRIDWPRRFDHMQQHAGEHLLSWAINRQLGGYVIGLHIGHDISSVDARLPGKLEISQAQIRALEDAVQGVIERDVPICSWFPTDEEYAKLPLRKPSSVEEGIRVVAIGEEEFVPCGGTHPSSSGQIAIFKLMYCRPNRGLMRFFFLCGMRAYRDYQAACAQRDALTGLLSKPSNELVPAVEKLLNRLKSLEFEMNATQIARAKACLDRAMSSAININGASVVMFREDNLNADAQNALLSDIIAHENTCALLLSYDGSATQVVFGCASGVKMHMGDALRDFMKLHNSKGGGRETYARGSAPCELSTADLSYHALRVFLANDG